MVGNRKLYWFNYVKVVFFLFNTKSGDRKSIIIMMLP